jgi:hypothetical protein
VSELEPLVVVTADHGEALGEHGEHSHGILLQEATLRIPLILHAPDALGRNRHVDARTSQVDLLPTIASLLDIEVADDLDGVDLTTVAGSDRPVLAEAVDWQARYGWAGLTAIYHGPLKLVDGPHPELFDLDADSLDGRNLYSQQSEKAERLRRELEAMRGEHARLPTPSNDDLDPLEIAKLEALGYLVAQGQTGTISDGGPDPKEMLPILQEMFDVIGRLESDATQTALQRLFNAWILDRHPVEKRADLIEPLEKLATEHPDFAPVHQELATLYEQEGRSADAESARQHLIEIVGATATD